MYADDMFNDAFTEISAVNGCEWDRNTRIVLFGEFLTANGRNLFAEWEKFLQQRADEENVCEDDRDDSEE